ncbi:alpha/beta hydrolase, partial [Salmonella enterica subsp. enterica serovar Anatum]|nr:alpha/beta hydrolase [Salmonella enterica subsp. enterica serovar Anatum]
IQRKNIELAARTIAQLTRQWRVVLVHGNGPQVGLLALQNSAYEEAAQRLPGSLREMEFAVPGGSPVTAFLHMPKGDGPFPTV